MAEAHRRALIADTRTSRSVRLWLSGPISRLLSTLMILFSTSALAASEVTTVEAVDLDQYLGLWYEIASFPAWFQRGCTATTAEYSLRDDGLIRVVNTCRRRSVDGKLKQSVGRAKVVDPETNAKLKVSFFGPFWGDYWILDLDPEYRWAIVGVPSRRYLWILSRTPTLHPELLATITEPLKSVGFDLTRLRKTEHPVTESWVGKEKQ